MMTSDDRTRERWGSWLPAGMVASMATLTGAWAVLGTLSDGYQLWDIVVERYSAIHQPISGLGLGSTAAWMNSAFVVSGVFGIAGAIGIGKTVGRDRRELEQKTKRWLALPGIGSILCGLFTLEQMPLHSLGFLFVVSPIVGYVAVGRDLQKAPNWNRVGRLLAKVASPSIAALTIAFFATFNPEQAGENRGVAGLTQRLLILAIQGSLAALAIAALQNNNSSRRREPGHPSERPITESAQT